MNLKAHTAPSLNQQSDQAGQHAQEMKAHAAPSLGSLASSPTLFSNAVNGPLHCQWAFNF
jgi:hypothetical protein